MIHIDYRDSKPIYEQIADGFENLIGRGVIEKDSQLPSVRLLAMELSINPNTIQKAYSELLSRGMTYSVKGKGIFVASQKESFKERKLSELFDKMRKLILEATASGISGDEILSVLVNVQKTIREGA